MNLHRTRRVKEAIPGLAKTSTMLRAQIRRSRSWRRTKNESIWKLFRLIGLLGLQHAIHESAYMKPWRDDVACPPFPEGIFSSPIARIMTTFTKDTPLSLTQWVFIYSSNS